MKLVIFDTKKVALGEHKVALLTVKPSFLLLTKKGCFGWTSSYHTRRLHKIRTKVFIANILLFIFGTLVNKYKQQKRSTTTNMASLTGLEIIMVG